MYPVTELKNGREIKGDESYSPNGVHINITSDTTPEEKEEIAKKLKSERDLVSLQFQGKRYRSVKNNIA
jgi:hypothetical protein